MDGFYIKPNSLLKLQNKVRKIKVTPPLHRTYSREAFKKKFQRAIIFSYCPHLRSFPPYFYVIMGYHVVLCSLL